MEGATPGFASVFVTATPSTATRQGTYPRNLVVNQIQDVNTLYTSTPEWSWWVAHAMFGATLGLVASTLLHREPA